MKGTVFFRQSKSTTSAERAKKQGTWTYAFSVPKADGKRRQITKGGFTTKKAAEEALTEALANYGRSPASAAVEPSKLPFARYVRDEWLPTLHDLKPTTRASYENLAEAYAIPHIGDTRICDVTPGQLTKLYNTLRTSGRKRPSKRLGPGLSESSVHHVHVVLSAAFGHAVETQMLRVSPVAILPKKSRPAGKKAARPEMKVWTAEQAQVFIEAASEDRLGAMFDLDLNTGLRRGELVGLRWVDVDFDRAVLAVRRNRVAVGYAVDDTTPKSHMSRVVDLDPDTVAMLRAHRRRQLEERLAWGEAWTDTGLVFTREDGTALHPMTASWHFRRLVRETNKAITKAHSDRPGAAVIPTIRLHDLRHTHATLGLAAGVPPKVMQERLGHSSIQITMDLYSHVIPGMQADAAAKIAGLLRRAQ